MTERTPGPWQVSPNDAATVTDSKSEFVAYVAVKADARLISAAPDMLAALEKMRYQSRAAWMTMGSALRSQCEAAIAKAKGES